MQVMSRLLGPPPLAHLARAHALGTAADACVSVSLAGSLFFALSVDAARPRLALYLLLTLTPFAVVAPLIGPLADRFRHGRPAFVSFTGQGRALLSLFMAVDLKNLLLYPESFGVLVLGKAYSVTKSSLVPELVDDPGELVAANSRLSRIGALAAAIGGGIGVGVLALAGPVAVLRVAALVHLAGAALALRIPAERTTPVESPTQTGAARPEVTDMRAALVAMAMLRASVGLVTFLLAFALKRAGVATAFFGAVALAAAVGNFAGTVISPVLRRRTTNEHAILAIALGLSAVGAAVATWHFGRPGMLLAAFATALGANVGRQAFDSLLQRATPVDERSRRFARSETMFQIVWVLGALIPTVFDLDARLGLLGLAVLLASTTGVAILRPGRAGRAGR